MSENYAHLASVYRNKDFFRQDMTINGVMKKFIQLSKIQFGRSLTETEQKISKLKENLLVDG